ncbi:MAG: SUMF1/EgtB/PvdO family nonheme iron enzyme [Chloroflexi bacterium]|nr:SUMF1/EgtB/PvdO family nonheme iron enzyme [Chloroflexota bacterium]
MPEEITQTNLRVFLASPNDVADERKRVARVVDAMNADGGEAFLSNVHLKLLRWETDAVPDVGRPEQVLLDQFDPTKWDIFIGILWLRFGSGTGGTDPDTKQPYLSGTDEEFKTAYRLREAREDGFPKIMVYRCARPPAQMIGFDWKQYARVEEFFNGYPGLYQTYTAPEEFGEFVRQHLAKRVAEFAAARRAMPRPNAPPLAPRAPTDAERHAALTHYLKQLRGACDRLPLQAIEADDPRRHPQVSLDQVYIELDTTARVPLTEEEKTARPDRARLEHAKERPLSVLEAAEKHSRVVITGDPGSGKSSFVNRLAFLLASARLGRASLPAQWTHGALLPVRVFLRDLAPTLADETALARLATDARERVLSDAVREFIAKLPATFDAPDAAPLILQMLNNGECLVIFDGLDEVAPQRRRVARAAVEAFAQRCADNRFLVTCRVRSYQNDARLPSFAMETLDQLDDDKVNKFIADWYAALAGADQIPRDQTGTRAEDLQRAIADAQLRRLADTPLLLTTMAVVHYADYRLPRERARLYKRCVEILLRRWQIHKQGPNPLFEELKLDEATQDNMLRRVAFEAHTRGNKDEAADLPKRDVIALLEKYVGGAGNAERFLHYVEDRAGLLVARGGVDEDEPVYAFPHRTFQEFLAGCYLAFCDELWRELRTRLSDGDKWEVAGQLGAEHLLYNSGDNNRVLGALYVWLCPMAEPKDDLDRRGIVWAGNIAAEMSKPKILQDKETPGGGAQFLDHRLIPRLVQLIERGLLSPLERAQAGVALAKLGDPRPGVGVSLPLHTGEGLGMGVPDLTWCEIPAGPFTMGTRAQDIPGLMEKYGGDKSWYEYETPQHEEKSITRAYLIAKYPVTNAQFNAFVNAGGYKDARYWREAIAAGYWNDGKFKGYFDNEPRDHPVDYGSPFNLDNHPVVGVSWYEAVAFCHWLAEKFQMADFRFQIDRIKDANLKSAIENRKLKICLPTEAEWEKSARAMDGRIFPWNGELTTQHANYSATNLRATSAVGAFPLGASPYGLMDVSGNVWEWCGTKWIDSYKNYDDQSQDRESLEGDTPRVVRGGAWSGDDFDVRSASRLRDDPDYGNDYVGFRLSAGVS